MQAVKNHPNFNLSIFCTGMHLMSKYGYTVTELQKAGFSDNIFHFLNQVEGESMEITLSNTIAGLSRYLCENPVDLIIIHGDRIEALAGAIVGALRNQLVGHIEGGEVSGTIDDLLRHATSKMAHIHFVASSIARQRLIQLGELEKNIFKIGSPDVDVMLSDNLPSLDEVRQRYDIKYEHYAIAILHPVTTEVHMIKKAVTTYIEVLRKSGRNYVVVYPNNDMGSEHILAAIEQLKELESFRVFPSLRFEYFLTLLKNSEFIIGNSSAGIHEAPVYGVPTIDIGSRQRNRFRYKSIRNVDFSQEQLLSAIEEATQAGRYESTTHYGKGDSAQSFIRILESQTLWETEKQKPFVDL
ncbi:MAG: UDP-N-acetylglucosamine 2-epimerase [Flavobacteriales bacterium]|nr:UDP-N-acetylglucosamine 2-epimerase [Flavobacteriales bacterium]